MLGEEKQGIYRKPDVITSMIGRAGNALDFILVPVNGNQINLLNQVDTAVQKFKTELTNLKSTKMTMLKEYDQNKSLNLFN